MVDQNWSPPQELATAIEEALDMVRAQMENPHVYDKTTQEALDKISAYAALFKMESAYASLSGYRNRVTFYNKTCDALEYVINSLKYKINAAVKISY